MESWAGLLLEPTVTASLTNVPHRLWGIQRHCDTKAEPLPGFPFAGIEETVDRVVLLKGKCTSKTEPLCRVSWVGRPKSIMMAIVWNHQLTWSLSLNELFRFYHHQTPVEPLPTLLSGAQ